MEPLPVELFIEVLGFLPGKYIFHARQVCAGWNKIISNSIVLWSGLCERDFGAKEKDESESWMQTYKNRAR
jgi:hypothetical protein